MLSLRLKEIASLIEKDFINVGTDHALLELYLAKEKNLNSIGIDINYNSIIKSINNIKGYEDKIKIIQNDGLNNINISDKLIVISGLGTKTILKIIKNIKKNDLLIQSNNNLYELRKKIIKKGYYIYNEKIVYDKKWYVIIYFKKGKKIYKKLDIYIGLNKNKKYIDYLIMVNEKKLQSIPNKYFYKKYKTKKIINQLKKL